MASGRELVTDFFVYGTLKRGECRESLWPCKPITVREGFIRARLYDLGLYPALRVDDEQGELPSHHLSGGRDDLDWVQGEVWSFTRSDALITNRILDEIEETNQRGYRNLYDHVLARVYDRPHAKASKLALVYQYSSSGRLSNHCRLRPRDGEIFVSWSAGLEER